MYMLKVFLVLKQEQSEPRKFPFDSKEEGEKGKKKGGRETLKDTL
jgi:hypothetical protein